MASRDPIQKRTAELRAQQAFIQELAKSPAYRWLLERTVEQREKARDRAVGMTMNAASRDWLAGVAAGLDQAMLVLEKESKNIHNELQKLVGGSADV